MAKPTNLIRSIINSTTNKELRSELDFLVGHPCGAFASAFWLAKHPKASRRVSEYLYGDAFSKDDGEEWNRWSFADSLKEMQDAGCALSRNARRLVKHWVNKGCPKPWASDKNRCYLFIEDEFWVNCPYEDMNWIYEAHLQAGGTAEYRYPSNEERAFIQSQPMVFANQLSTDIPF